MCYYQESLVDLFKLTFIVFVTDPPHQDVTYKTTLVASLCNGTNMQLIRENKPRYLRKEAYENLESAIYSKLYILSVLRFVICYDIRCGQKNRGDRGRVVRFFNIWQFQLLLAVFAGTVNTKQYYIY